MSKVHNHNEDIKLEHKHEHKHEEHYGCGCGHDHEHGGHIEGKEIGKIFLTAAFLVFAIFVGKYATDLSNKYDISLGTVETVSLVLYLVAYFTVGGEVVRTAVKNIRKGF